MTIHTTYTSATLAGSTTQSFFQGDDTPRLSRIYYKLYPSGSYPCALLFQNITDSTFASGDWSRCNMNCDPWIIRDIRIGLCDAAPMETAVEPSSWTPVTIAGASVHTFAPGESIWTDPVPVNTANGVYLCVEFTHQGAGRIPYHPERRFPTFVWDNDHFAPDTQTPVPCMVGFDRPVHTRVAFLGDSITQGIGATPGSYRHWAAIAAETRGFDDIAYWNLGIGYARASDAASDGAWLTKVKANDTAIVCLGVNDLMQGRTAAEVQADLTTVVDRLKEAGVKVILQSVPPFDYSGERLERWQEVIAYVKAELAPRCAGYFDNIALLALSEKEPQRARYGGHPDDAGSAVWGAALGAALREWV